LYFDQTKRNHFNTTFKHAARIKKNCNIFLKNIEKQQQI